MPILRRSPYDVALPGEPLHCPNDHKIPNDVWQVSSDAVAIYSRRCPAKMEPTNVPCEMVVGIVRFADGTRMAFEVSSSEAHAMEKMTIVTCLQFLSIRKERRAPRPSPAVER